MKYQHKWHFLHLMSEVGLKLFEFYDLFLIKQFFISKNRSIDGSVNTQTLIENICQEYYKFQNLLQLRGNYFILMSGGLSVKVEVQAQIIIKIMTAVVTMIAVISMKGEVIKIIVKQIRIIVMNMNQHMKNLKMVHIRAIMIITINLMIIKPKKNILELKQIQNKVLINSLKV